MADGQDREPDRRREGAGGGTGKVGAFSVSLFLVAVLMFLPPIVTLVEGPADVFGLPRVYFYLFAVWVAVVGGVYLIAERVRPADRDDQGT